MNPSFAVGGSAFLKPWFDAYRHDAPGVSFTIAAGDSVGATPPISSFFGDPTITMMNDMGFNADGLGNHNFDVSEEYLRDELIPLAHFPYFSANIVDSAGKTPPEWSPSRLFHIGDVSLAWSASPIPTFRRSLARVRSDRSMSRRRAAVNNEARRCTRWARDVVIAFGHMGATTGSLTNPSGPGHRPGGRGAQRRHRHGRPHRFQVHQPPERRGAGHRKPQ